MSLSGVWMNELRSVLLMREPQQAVLSAAVNFKQSRRSFG